ncbi:hypothetical protein P43SY_011867 [Pythium insidiosum]|uniref:Short chain dehydrogenase n=1 Tax=Pythium insidiosum TaxID=114742 RepID=A0AAD5Q3X8_PYTIN|nr:hypothetical protein P43SY_011867 [Pythium insidiosum]
MGLATARRLAHKHLHLILVGRDAAKLHRARQQLLQDGAPSVLTWTADLQDAKQVDALATKIQQLDDDVHVQHLVNAAGIFSPKPLLDHTRDDYRPSRAT